MYRTPAAQCMYPDENHTLYPSSNMWWTCMHHPFYVDRHWQNIPSGALGANGNTGPCRGSLFPRPPPHLWGAPVTPTPPKAKVRLPLVPAVSAPQHSLVATPCQGPHRPPEQHDSHWCKLRSLRVMERGKGRRSGIVQPTRSHWVPSADGDRRVLPSLCWQPHVTQTIPRSRPSVQSWIHRVPRAWTRAVGVRRGRASSSETCEVGTRQEREREMLGWRSRQ